MEILSVEMARNTCLAKGCQGLAQRAQQKRLQNSEARFLFTKARQRRSPETVVHVGIVFDFPN